jgi:hypothetical protein
MGFGVDFTSGPRTDTLVVAGVTFCCRYVAQVNHETEAKLLTGTEAMSHARAGISTVTNFEWTRGRATEGHHAGVVDAGVALGQHLAAGGPPDRPIYFSVDKDVSPAEVTPYFKGVASVLGLARTGVYGSFRVVKALKEAGLVTWCWQTYAWSQGAWFAGNNIEQYANEQNLDGHLVDHDRSRTADFGQWYPVSFGSQPPGVRAPRVQEEYEMFPVPKAVAFNADGSWRSSTSAVPVPLFAVGHAAGQWGSAWLKLLANGAAKVRVIANGNGWAGVTQDLVFASGAIVPLPVGTDAVYVGRVDGDPLTADVNLTVRYDR